MHCPPLFKLCNVIWTAEVYLEEFPITFFSSSFLVETEVLAHALAKFLGDLSIIILYIISCVVSIVQENPAVSQEQAKLQLSTRLFTWTRPSNRGGTI